MTVKLTVENAVQAKTEIEQGFTHDDIYIFAHDKNLSKHITDALDTEVLV